MQFEGIISRVYMFFGTRNPNLSSILKPKVDFMVFLRMRSNKIPKNGENAIQMQFDGLVPRVYMFFGTRKPNLRSILKPEVDLMVLLRMRSNKITENAENVLKIHF